MATNKKDSALFGGFSFYLLLFLLATTGAFFAYEPIVGINAPAQAYPSAAAGKIEDGCLFKLNVSHRGVLYLGVNSTFDVTVCVSDFAVPANGIMAFDMFLGYPSDLEFVGGQSLDPNNTAIPAFANNSPLKPGNYVFMGGLYAVADIEKDTQLYKFTFKLADGAALGQKTFEWVARAGSEPYGFVSGQTTEPFKAGEMGMPDLTFSIRLAGDIDGNGVVNALDLTYLLGEFNRAPVKYPGADIDGDGIVTAVDLTYLLASFNMRNIALKR